MILPKLEKFRTKIAKYSSSTVGLSDTCGNMDYLHHHVSFHCIVDMCCLFVLCIIIQKILKDTDSNTSKLLDLIKSKL